MDELGKLYTVEDIAKMTSLTSRTIRNYLKEGILKGKKIGGQWRFSIDNVKQLFDNGSFDKEVSDNRKRQVVDFIDGVNTDIQGKIQICAIADYYCKDSKEAKNLCDKLDTVIKSKNNHFVCAKFDYEFIGKENKARFILMGDPDFIIKTLLLLK